MNFMVMLTLFDAAGGAAQAVTFEFAGNFGQFVYELFTDVPLGFMGLMWFESENPLHLTVLRL